MGYIVRREVGQPKYSQFKDNTNKFTDSAINILFYELNNDFADELKDFYGFYVAKKLGPVSPKFSEYSKLTTMSTGKFNAYTEIYAVTNEQLYRSPIGKKNNSDITKFSTEELKKCAEENCKAFVDKLNDILPKMKSETYQNLEAVLMNREYDLVKVPGYGTIWTTVLVKFRYKK